MKNFRILMLAFLGVFSLTSCGDENKKDQESNMPMQNDTRMEHEDSVGEAGNSGNLDDGEATEVEFADDRLAAVYGHYLHIKSALVNTNAEEAQSGGEAMVAALEAVNGNENSLEAAREIAGNANINEQRTAFSDLSAAVEEMVSGAISSGELYKQYCPMAFEGDGGYWLSSSQEIRNPYYGDKMLKCGAVEDTIQ